MDYFYNKQDTIAAIATAPGDAAISIIRISGKDAVNIANKIFSGNVNKYLSHTVHYGKVLDNNKNIVDSVLLTVMLNPKSYTGEDSVEIACHGGSVITRKVFETILDAGCRAAGPGEFSFRAFMHGKIDLLQAEAVQEVVSAKNTLAVKAATSQLEGNLSSHILEIQNKLIELAASTEAWIDFPEDIDSFELETIKTSLTEIKNKLIKLEQTFHEGKILFDGCNMAIIGVPNVGKSSLMNLLCKKERAIVTPIAGTTRDTIEETILLNNLHFKIIDTAGIRDTDEVIEKEGIKRSQKASEEADIILLMFEAGKDLSKEELELLKNCDPKKTVVVWNKIDTSNSTIKKLPSHYNYIVSISAKENIGLENLKEAIEKLIKTNNKNFAKDEVILTNIRHKTAVKDSLKACMEAINTIEKDMPLEFIVEDIKECLNKLNNILGHNVAEDILSSIFSKFCIGK